MAALKPAASTDFALRNQIERIPCCVFKHAQSASEYVAGQIADLIRQRAAEGKPCVLGLATGSTPTTVYAELVRLHREEGLSFAGVHTFNLDEYYPMQPNELQSYVRFMNENLFDHIDIDRANVRIPDGTLAEEDVLAHCANYEQQIEELGGVDIQVLGIGRTGHIGFNEPGSGRDSRTRMITLDKKTRQDASSDFFGEDYVPRRAITMGVGTILESAQIYMLAFGEGKAKVVAEAVEGEVTPIIAASFLQDHPNSIVVLDEAAAARLTRYQAPWLLGPLSSGPGGVFEWNDEWTRKAVIWLATKLGKPILKLTEEDYNEEGLQELLAKKGRAYDINLQVFRQLQATISGWPGGKPPERRQPGDRRQAHDDIFPKRIICFSPHPDDDVISMGGTLIRLCDQGHEVHIAYQTSGNVAVFDDDAIRYAEFMSEFNRQFGIDPEQTAKLEEHVETFLKNKQPGQVDSPEVQAIKGLIRRTEARAGARVAGVPEERCRFLDMPFYQTGRVRKNPLGEDDVELIMAYLEELQPHQLYCAGDLSDPHGTHRTCLRAILTACDRLKDRDWMQHCVVWLYRGAWQEWEPHQIEMAVPLSPQELLRKRNAIFKHESQKDKALFPGSDPREFWQRAEDRNRGCAQLYDRLGLSEFEAIEGFVRWKGELDGVV
ncbi:Glucosamine-6-phosphate deaminase 1 [Botrimarina colliarenosi]|uniref:Glucosamine-6-phosphate deaminase n=1 Tax=Botrimarina colliarenosi TaxID=2528001 RepID=A0A5C6ALU8_9BACT|nr:glucosamine-6-phosphate deaminase [Botrimarina colliarenosi]TWU00249.1 Glucosamine-6-phosphate deaminase 1 [Botrimarina colliarenosi]